MAKRSRERRRFFPFPIRGPGPPPTIAATQNPQPPATAMINLCSTHRLSRSCSWFSRSASTLALAGPLPMVSLITDPAAGEPANHGASAIRTALGEKGLSIEETNFLAGRRPRRGFHLGRTRSRRRTGRRLARPASSSRSDQRRSPGHSTAELPGQNRLGPGRVGRYRADVRRTRRGGPHRLEHERRTAAGRASRDGGKARHQQARHRSLHHEPGLLGEPLLRRGLLAAVPRDARARPFQRDGRRFRLRKRRLSRARLSLLF